jgi:hypothetical protein
MKKKSSMRHFLKRSITTPRSLVLPLSHSKTVHANPVVLNRYRFHKSMFCVAEPTFCCATETWRPAGPGTAAAAWKRFYRRCLWSWFPDVYVINYIVCVCVCVCPSRIFHHTLHSVCLTHTSLLILLFVSGRRFCIFKYWEVKCRITLQKKLMILQNMINESKDFVIWTQYFIQDFIFFRPTLLCITKSAIDIWKFLVNTVCKGTDIMKESTFAMICITLKFIRSE